MIYVATSKISFNCQLFLNIAIYSHSKICPHNLVFEDRLKEQSPNRLQALFNFNLLFEISYSITYVFIFIFRCKYSYV